MNATAMAANREVMKAEKCADLITLGSYGSFLVARFLYAASMHATGSLNSFPLARFLCTASMHATGSLKKFGSMLRKLWLSADGQV
jgi:hypothetical protein